MRHHLLFVGAVAALAATHPTRACAQEDSQLGTAVGATPKGTIGLGLIGAELGLVIPAVSGLHDVWATITFPLVGAAGGAVAGYFAIDNRGASAGAVAALATGAALVVPSLVITMMARTYRPREQAPNEARGAVSLTRSDPAATGPSLEAGAGLLRVEKLRRLWLAVPGLGVESERVDPHPAMRGEAGRVARLDMTLLSGSF